MNRKDDPNASGVSGKSSVSKSASDKSASSKSNKSGSSKSLNTTTTSACMIELGLDQITPNSSFGKFV